jgi:hypothetical protein
VCKAYGAKVLIQAQMTAETNNTEKDIIPHLSLDIDCCQTEGKNVSLNDIHLELPLKNIINHLDDLRVASHKVDDVERLISEQEWKMKHSNIDHHLSFLSYVGMISTSLIVFIFCYCCCCKCCRKNCPNLSKWWKNNNPCTTIVFKPKIVYSVHSSRESLKLENSRPFTKSRNSQCDAIEVTKLVTLNPKYTINSGKR